jgi:hypothetical protein
MGWSHLTDSKSDKALVTSLEGQALVVENALRIF